MSHTIRGNKDLSIEQAFAICEFIGLSEEETDYFILLVQLEPAGNIRLKNKFKTDLKKLKLKTQNLVTRVATDSVLTESQRAQFYSSWIYSALRQLSSIDEYQTRAKLISTISNGYSDQTDINFGKRTATKYTSSCTRKRVR